MLILTRRPTETVMIGGSVTLTVLDIKGSRVRIGVDAPRDIIVMRQEQFQKSRTEHRLPDAGP
jgi:carbon storage regulator